MQIDRFKFKKKEWRARPALFLLEYFFTQRREGAKIFRMVLEHLSGCAGKVAPGIKAWPSCA